MGKDFIYKRVRGGKIEDNNDEMEKKELEEEIRITEEKIKEYENNIEKNKKLLSLEKNEAFKEIILDGYFKEEADRIFTLLTTPTHLKKDVIDNLNEKLASIRHLKEYFGLIQQYAFLANENLEQEKEYLKVLKSNNRNEVIKEKIKKGN